MPLLGSEYMCWQNSRDSAMLLYLMIHKMASNIFYVYVLLGSFSCSVWKWFVYSLCCQHWRSSYTSSLCRGNDPCFFLIIALTARAFFWKTLIRYQHIIFPQCLQDGVALPHTALALPYGGDVCLPAQHIFITSVILSIWHHDLMYRCAFSPLLLCVSTKGIFLLFCAM
jgi:hypothetical protein